MQVMFLVLFGVSLVLFSLLVRECVGMLPGLLAGDAVPLRSAVQASGWLVLFVVSFLGTGLFLYERERDEGRIGRRIRVYDWLLDRRRAEDGTDDSRPKPIRRS